MLMFTAILLYSGACKPRFLRTNLEEKKNEHVSTPKIGYKCLGELQIVDERPWGVKITFKQLLLA